MKAVKIGLAGIGTVGGGTYAVLTRNADLMVRRAGAPIEVSRVVCRNLDKARKLVSKDVKVSGDWRSITEDPEIDIAVELMGGIEPARTFVLAAIESGKHVVTANKALLAKHGNEIFEAAERKGVIVAFEAAVAGGIPIIKALREGLAANRVEWIAGIINGTSNYILSTMRDEGITFADALARAQKLGYAEADPTFDIEGVDAAHKLTLLSAIAFGTPVNFDAAYIEGISTLSATDIAYAEQFGYRIKLLGITKRRENDGVELRVHPTLVPMRRLIANVEGVMNAVLVKGDAVGHSLYYGRGAGAEPTASAVIADIVDVVRMLGAAKQHQVPVLGARVSYMEKPNWLPMDETVSSYYLRVAVADKPGVLAVIAGVLGENNISIETLIQREAAIGEDCTDIVMLTHRAKEGDVRKAIEVLENNECVKSKIVMLRKEDLN
ncbi:MAG: homoserine dehydrogenase [Duodenibacillus sp.]|nr:homoserine dehydrogenase [Duodenibacillus sp.]